MAIIRNPFFKYVKIYRRHSGNQKNTIEKNLTKDEIWTSIPKL